MFYLERKKKVLEIVEGMNGGAGSLGGSPGMALGL